MSDLLLWRDKRNSGILFVLVTAVFAYLQFSTSGPAVHLFQVMAVLSFACFLWGQAALILGRSAAADMCITQSSCFQVLNHLLFSCSFTKPERTDP